MKLEDFRALAVGQRVCTLDKLEVPGVVVQNDGRLIAVRWEGGAIGVFDIRYTVEADLHARQIKLLEPLSSGPVPAVSPSAKKSPKKAKAAS